MSLSSFLLGRHCFLKHRVHEPFSKAHRALRAAVCSHNVSAFSDVLEPRVLMTATPLFNSTTTAITGETTSTGDYVIVADMDGDGKKDLVTYSKSDHTLTVLWSNGKGTITAETPMSLGTDIDPDSMIACDMNSDGAMDLVFVNSDNRTISVRTQKTSGGKPLRQFNDPVSYTLLGEPAASPTAVVAGDFNGDGATDLVVSSAETGKIYMFEGHIGTDKKPDGTLTIVEGYYNINGVTSMTVADLNKDGKSDLIVTRSGLNSVSVLLGVKNGSFFGSPATFAVGTAPNSVVTGDFNGDGYLDVAVSNSGGNNVSVLFNDSRGVLKTAVNYALGATPSALYAADMNGDTVLDLVSFNKSDSTFSVVLGNPDGTFGSAISFAADAGASPQAANWGVVTDFTGDGMADLVSSSSLPMTIMLRSNVTTEVSRLVTAKTSFSYVDSSGNTVKVKMSGPGTAVVTVNNVTSASIMDVAVFGTTSATTLSFSVSKASTTGARYTSISKLDLGSSALGSFDGANVNLDEEGVITGGASSYISNLVLHDIGNDASISILGKSATALKVAARHVGTGVTIDLGTNAVSTASFVAVDQDCVFKAASVATFKVTGDKDLTGNFKADVQLSGNSNVKAATLGTFSVSGAFTATGKLTITGFVSTISLGSCADSQNITVSGSIGKFQVGGDFHGADISAASITTITVSGGFYDCALTLGATNANLNAVLLTSLTVGGALGKANGLGFTIDTHGANIGTIKAGAISTATMTAGDIGKIYAVGGKLLEGNIADTTITADTLNLLDIAGDADSLHVYVGHSEAAGKNVINTITIDGAVSESTFDTGQNGGKGGYGTITFGSASNTVVNTHDDAIGKLTILDDITGGSLTAAKMGTWTIKGDLSHFACTLGIDGMSASTVVLQKLDIRGTITDLTLTGEHGSAGAISAASLAGGKVIFADGLIKSLTIKGSADFGTGGELTANSFGTISIGNSAGGDLKNVVISCDLDPAQSTNVIGTLKVTGGMNTVQISATGTHCGIGTLSTGYMTNSIINAGGKITTLNVTRNVKLGNSGNWLGGSLHADSIQNMKIDGSMTNTALTIAGSQVSSAQKSLSKLTVSADVSGTTITISNGIAGTISLKSMTGGSITADDDIGTLSISGDMTGTSETALAVTARSVGTWTLAGSMSYVDAQLGNQSTRTTIESGKRTVVLGKLSVGKDISHSSIVADGSMGSISAKRLTDSDVTVGYSMDTHQYLGLENISSIIISGDKSAPTSSAIGNQLFGWKIGTLSMTYPGDNSAASTIDTTAINTLKIVRLNNTSNVTKTYTKLDSLDQESFAEAGLSMNLRDMITIPV